MYQPSRVSSRNRSRLTSACGFFQPVLEVLEDRLAPASTRFAMIGDFGQSGQGELDVANLVKSWSPDYIVSLGDNNYPAGAQSTIDGNIGRYYHDYIGNYHGSFGAGSATDRFFPILGNHDWDTSNASPYLNYFTLPGNERYYDFTQGPVEFFMVDSDDREPDGVDANSIQGQWLHSELAASTATYKLVLFHHAPYTSDADPGHQITYMRWPFQAWGATAVLSGHDHNYERLLEDNNLPYFINGLGGAEITDFGAIQPGSQVRYNADFGAMLVSADDTQMTFQFYARTGSLIDAYSIPAAHNTTLVSAGSAWKYLDNGSNQGTAWRAPAFSDAAWQAGAAQLGYGDGDEQTVVGFGPDAGNKYITTYFRRSFNVTAPSAFSGLTLSLQRDDGAVVYLNGTEVYRSNLPSGTIGYQTLASAAVTGTEESQWFPASISPSLLVAGNNVLAVEIHQCSATSPDISFNLSLVAAGSAVAAGPVFAVNAGGSAASPFAADSGFSGGGICSTSATIITTGVTNPAPQSVYQTERYGDCTYTAANLTPGASYTVRLHFAEISWTSAGSRHFDVLINGAQVLTDFDIYAAAGGANRAIVKQFTARADSTGKIVITFLSKVGHAAIGGIEILPGSSQPPTVFAANAGGAAAGTFEADSGFSGGSTYSTTAPISTTGVTSPAPQAVYQTERYGDFTYTAASLTPGASYTVRLHFAEIYFTSANQRLFSVNINGTQVLSGFDVFAEAGGINKAIVRQFTATADSTGKIVIQFVSTVNNAKVSGIEIL